MGAGRSPAIDVAMPPYRDGAIPCSKGGRERVRLFRVQPARGTLRSKTGAAVSKDVRRWSLVGLPFPAPPLSRSYRKFRPVIVSRHVEAGVEIGRAHVCTPVNNAHIVCGLLL